MFFKRPPLKPVQLNNSDIFQLHTPDNINSRLLDSSIEHHHHNLAPPKKKLRIDSSFFDESFAVDPQLNPSPIPRVPSQSPTWDTASGLNGFAASSFQIYGGYLPEFFPDMTDTPSSITETSHIESKPPLSSSSSIKPQPLSSSKPQPSSGSKPPPSSSSKPPPSSSNKRPPPPVASLNLLPATNVHFLQQQASTFLQQQASTFLQQQASTWLQQQASFFRRPWHFCLVVTGFLMLTLMQHKHYSESNSLTRMVSNTLYY